jgi:beta-hydroxylase
MEPEQELAVSRPRRLLRRAQSIAVFALLDANDGMIDRLGPDRPAVYDPSDWKWIARLEAAAPDIKAEIEAYADGGALPHVASVSGLDPETEEGHLSVPGVKGAWRTVILFANGRWIDETARHFPRTVACFRDLHPKANVGFSALDPRSHIEPHVGPNRGSLRVQLPVVVPGEYGDCRIRVGDDLLRWREGHAVVFDLSVDHEAWNDTDERRVLLMVEIPMPLPVPLAWVNRATQYSYRWHPSYRGMTDRIARFGREHDARAPAPS